MRGVKNKTENSPLLLNHDVRCYRHCFHAARLSGVAVSCCCSHCMMAGRQEVSHCMPFKIGSIADNSVWSANYSQTHTRRDKEITQGHTDIMVYKSSINTQ